MGKNIFKSLFNERRLTQTEVAQNVGVTRQAVAYWLKGNLPTGDKLDALCKYLDVEPSYLAYGISENNQATDNDDSVISIPVLENQGTNNNELPEPIAAIQVSKLWIMPRIKTAKLEDIRIVNVLGNTMAPTLQDGDCVIIDTSITNFVSDGVYVFRFGDNLIIKRAQLHFDGSLWLISDDNAFPPMQIKGKEKESLEIVGKCLTLCTFRDI